MTEGKLISPTFEAQLRETVRKVQTLSTSPPVAGNQRTPQGTQIWLAKVVDGIDQGNVGQVKLLAGTTKGVETTELTTHQVYNRWSAVSAGDWVYVGRIGGTGLEVLQGPPSESAYEPRCGSYTRSPQGNVTDCSGTQYKQRYLATIRLFGSDVTLVFEHATGCTWHIVDPVTITHCDDCDVQVHQLQGTLTVLDGLTVGGLTLRQATIVLQSYLPDGATNNPCYVAATGTTPEKQPDVTLNFVCLFWHGLGLSRFEINDPTAPLWQADSVTGFRKAFLENPVLCVTPYEGYVLFDCTYADILLPEQITVSDVGEFSYTPSPTDCYDTSGFTTIEANGDAALTELAGSFDVPVQESWSALPIYPFTPYVDLKSYANVTGTGYYGPVGYYSTLRLLCSCASTETEITVTLSLQIAVSWVHDRIVGTPVNTTDVFVSRSIHVNKSVPQPAVGTRATIDLRGWLSSDNNTAAGSFTTRSSSALSGVSGCACNVEHSGWEARG